GYAEVRLLRGIEAAVAVQHHRRLPVLDEAALARDEHRHASAVLAAIEDLFSDERVSVERDLWRAEDADLAACDVQARDRSRRQVIGVGEERLAVLHVAEEPTGAAESRQLHVVERLAVQVHRT